MSKKRCLLWRPFLIDMVSNPLPRSSTSAFCTNHSSNIRYSSCGRRKINCGCMTSSRGLRPADADEYALPLNSVTVRSHQVSNEHDQTGFNRKMLGLAASGTFVQAVLAEAAVKTSAGGQLRLGGRSSNFVVGTSETEAKTEGEKEEEKKEAQQEEEKYQEYEVVLTQPYGIKFTKGGDGGTYIDAIAPDGSTDKSGVIAVGDKVLATPSPPDHKLVELEHVS